MPINPSKEEITANTLFILNFLVRKSTAGLTTLEITYAITNGKKNKANLTPIKTANNITIIVIKNL